MRKFEFVNRLKGKSDFYDRLPERSTKNSAGYDFFNTNDVVCKSHQITMIPTGIKAKFPEDEMLLLFNRSSNPKKKGLIILNGVGVVDSDYYGNADNDGEMAFVFYNMLDEDVRIEAGEKLGQGIFVKYAKTDDDIAEGERQGGFGSTGK
ncbi:MAG: dUTP diphosphatase [Clostridia bacterium]|nr:dUTP diphosphatase [Clostridia bacterium]